MNLNTTDSSLPFISLAPMEGVVDYVVRDLLTALGGLDQCVTEFVRVTDKLLPEHVFHKYCPELTTGGYTRSGTVCFVQLLGGQPEPIKWNARRLALLGAPGIDLNFGCPAKTVNRHDGGATLLKNPHRLFDIILSAKQGVFDSGKDIPVTAKVRLGFEDKSLVKEIALAVSEAKAHRLTIHARTKVEGYKPPAHWEFIGKMREFATVPVIANGDIWSVEDYFRCREASGCKDIALGRSLIAKPDLARLIKAACLAEVKESMSWQTVLDEYLPQFFHKTLEYKTEKYAMARMKQYLKMMSREYTGATEMFESIKRLQTPLELRQQFSQF